LEANTRNLARLFDHTIQYQVPLFQRPYVWTQESNLTALWEDVQARLDKQLRSMKVHPHFLGAIVLEQLANPAGSIESRQVIDGQQRCTTLQLFLMAARDHSIKHGNPKHIERFDAMVANGANRIDHPLEVYKVWPTNGDRPAFKLVFESRSLVGLESRLKAEPLLRLSNIVVAYQFFHEQIADWLEGALDDSEDEEALAGKEIEDRRSSNGTCGTAIRLSLGVQAS
jgi:hypothetical protein